MSSHNRLAILAGLAGLAFAAKPASASYIVSYVDQPTPAFPIGQSNVPGQIVSANGTFPTDNVVDEKSYTYMGVNHAYAAAGATKSSVATAGSQWEVDFTLHSAKPVELGIGYYYHATVSPPGSIPAGAPNAGASFSYNIYTSSAVYDLFHVDATTQLGYPDHCTDRPEVTTSGGCAGPHSGKGVVFGLFQPGPNAIQGKLDVGGYYGGVSDAWGTAGVSDIIVPDGVTWTYDDPALQASNPLHFGYASGAPEPASWALMLFGVAALGAALRRRAAEPRIAAS